MFNLGMGEITVILLLALIFLGPSKLPELAAGLGKIIREIRKATSDVKNEIALDDTFRKPFEDLRDAVTLHPDELKRRDRIRQEMEEVRKRAEEASASIEAGAAPEGAAEDGRGAGAGAGLVDGETASDRQEAASNGTGDAAGRATPIPPPPIVTADHGPVPAPVPPPAPVAASPHVFSSTPVAPWENASAVVPPPPASATGTPPLHGAPAGTIARVKPTLRRVPPLGPTPAPPGLPPSASAHVVPPTSAADAANKTQILSENDLMPSAPGRPAMPPPPPGSGSGRTHASPPPLPGSTAPAHPPGSGPIKKT